MATLFTPGVKVCMIGSKVLWFHPSVRYCDYILPTLWKINIAGWNTGDINIFLYQIFYQLWYQPKGHVKALVGAMKRHQSCQWRSCHHMVDFGWCSAITNLAPKGEANLIPTWNYFGLNIHINKIIRDEKELTINGNWIDGMIGAVIFFCYLLGPFRSHF